MKSSFFDDYLSNAPQASSLMGGSFLDSEALASLVKTKSESSFASEIIEVLKSQNSVEPRSAQTTELLAKLDQPNCVTVATGQQCGLFLGPLFTLYKAAALIRLAKDIENKFKIPCVPIFWLQTEDHDFEEISSINSLGEDGASAAIRLALTEADSNNRRSVGALEVDQRIRSALLQLENTLDQSEFSIKTKELLEKNYTAGSNWASAFGSTLRQAFKNYGILTFDVRGASGSKNLSEALQTSLDKRLEISASLLQQRELLEKHSYESQVHVRENSPLFFYHPDGQDGVRYRLEESAGGNFSLIGANKDFVISAADISAATTGKAPSLSSSALLRPLIQDSLLPNVASILGPSELAYAAQITSLYQIFDIDRPLQVPRPHFQLLEPKISRILEKLDLEADDFWLGRTGVEEKLRNNLDISQRIDQAENNAKSSIESSLSALEEIAKELDPTLGKPANKTKSKMLSSLNPLLEKFRAAAVRSDATTSERLDRLEMALAPENTPQERHYAGISFLAKYGDMLVDKLVKESTPLEAVRKSINL